MQTVYNILLLFICLNTGVGVIAEAFSIDVGIPVVGALTDFLGLQQTMTGQLNNQGGFQVALIFGDWMTVGRMFVNFFTGGYILGMFELMSIAGINFPSVFVLGMGALFATAVVWGIMYLVSGRGTKQSD